MEKRISQAAHAYREDMVAFTQALVRVATENPPGARYKECVEVITAHLRRLGLRYQVQKVPVPAGVAPRYIVTSFFGRGRRTLYFHGHYDVVPASVPGQFVAERRGARLFGRGSTDMKSGLAAMVYAVRVLEELRVPLNGRIGLVFVPDEETGGRYGATWMARTGRLGANAVGMLLPEPTSGVVWHASRGAITLRVRVLGKTAHVGLQHLGVNAFEQMLPIAAALTKLKREVERRKTRYRVTPAAARHSILMLGGRVEGGTSANSVPGECSFTLERRFNPEENFAREKQRLFTIFDRARRQGVKLKIEILQEGAASGCSEDSPFAQALTRSIEQVTGRAPRFELCPGLLETRFYMAHGAPACSYGPGLLSVAHGPHEFVPVKNIWQCAAVYALTAARVLGPQA